MASEIPALLEQALHLPVEERLAIASALIESVNGAEDETWEEEWLTELDQRVAQAPAASATGNDWSTVRTRLVQRFRRP